VADENYKTLAAKLQCCLLWCSLISGCTFNRKLHIVAAKLNCFDVEVGFSIIRIDCPGPTSSALSWLRLNAPTESYTYVDTI